MNAQFHALLYVSELHSKDESPNMRRLSSVDRRIAVYLKLASRLAAGIHRFFGSRLVLITNRPKYLEELIAKISRQQAGFCSVVDIVEIPFTEMLPSGARFHSATNKIFALEYFSKQPGYHFLLDLDIICQRPFSEDVVRRVEAGESLVYDISEQVFPDFGYPRIAEDLRKFCGEIHEFRWYGGEFIGGEQKFFSQLFAVLQPMIAIYGECWESLHHQGDEIIVSSALNLLRKRHGAGYFCDVAPLEVIRRHWGIPTAHDERKFRQYQTISFVHLPAAKGMLASSFSDPAVLGLMRSLNNFPPLLTKAVGAGFSAFQ
jgi:hypothetical protein